MIPKRSPQITSPNQDLCGEILTSESKLWIGYKASQPKVSMVELASNWNIPLSSVKQFARSYQRLYVRTEHTRLEKALNFIKSLFPKMLVNFLGNLFNRVLPQTVFLEDVNQVPKLWKVVITLVYNLGYIVLLFYLAFASYSSLRNKSFISLQRDSGVCEEVVRPTSGQFLASLGVNYTNYAWSTNPGFNFNTTAFALGLSSFKSTTEDFAAHMNAISELLLAVGTKGANRDFAWNAVAWTVVNYVSNTVEGGVLSFQALGDPAVLFGAGSYAAAVTSSEGYCNASMVVDFDLATSTYKLTMTDYMATAAPQTCSDQFDPAMLQAETLGVPSADFTMELDMVAYTFAVALNYGLIDVGSMVQVVDSSLNDDDFTPYTDDSEYNEEFAFPALNATVLASGGRKLSKVPASGGRTLSKEDEPIVKGGKAPEISRGIHWTERFESATTSEGNRLLSSDELRERLTGQHANALAQFTSYINKHNKAGMRETGGDASQPRPGAVRLNGSGMSGAERERLVRKTRGKVDSVLLLELERQSADVYRSAAGGMQEGRRLEDESGIPVVHAYYSAQFLGMDPVYCVVFPVAGRQCTILAQKTLLYPLLNVLGTQNMSSIIDSLSQFDLDMTHYPSNITKTDTSSIDTSSGRCTPCGRAMSQNEAFECERTHFLSSFVFFPHDSKNLTNLLTFVYQTGLMNSATYDAHAADIAFTPALVSLLQNFAFDFTGKSDLTAIPGTPVISTNRYPELFAPLCTGCSMITILKYADAGAPIVNEYHLKMSRGASCSNSFLRGDTFSNLFTPPLDLTERYYECVMPVGDAIFEALGLSIGNAEIIFGCGSILFFLSIATYLRIWLGYRDNTFESPDDIKDGEGEGGYDGGVERATKDEVDHGLSAVTRSVHNVRVDTQRQMHLLAKTLIVEVKVLQSVQVQSVAALEDSLKELKTVVTGLRVQSAETQSGSKRPEDVGRSEGGTAGPGGGDGGANSENQRAVAVSGDAHSMNDGTSANLSASETIGPVYVSASAPVSREEYAQQQKLMLRALELIVRDRQRELQVSEAANESLECMSTELAKLDSLTAQLSSTNSYS